jgi:hypothetical protein
MFKPIQAARSAGKFTSLDTLAKRLMEAAPELEWLAPRALAVKIGDIDRGDKVWWIKRRPHALALAALLEVPLVDLGLHEAPVDDIFKFAAFPELPPFVLARDTACDLGFVDAVDRKPHQTLLEFWLDPVPPRHAWRGPEQRISWLEFVPGSGLSFFWAILCASTRHERVRVKRLADAVSRLRQPGNLIVRIEQPCNDADLAVLGHAHDDLNFLIVAPFAPPSKSGHGSSRYLPSWEILTGQVDERVTALTDSSGWSDAITPHSWRLHDDWQARLLGWVEKRMGRATEDTLLSAAGVTRWLATFPDDWHFVTGPAELLAICRLCHSSRETGLPRVTDSDAGQRLLKAITHTNNVLARRFAALVAARLDAHELPWQGALPMDQWARLSPEPAANLDAQTLLEIADGKSPAERRQRAAALSERIASRSVAPLVDARLLVQGGDGILALTPQFLVDLVARDQLMHVIRDEPIERWAMHFYDPARRALLEAALRSVPVGDLLPVLDRLKALPADTLLSIAAAEVLFRDIGKRLGGATEVPGPFAWLAGAVLSRIDVGEISPTPWTRSDQDEDSVEWIAICWAWSLWADKPALEIPPLWEWWFPGWVPDLTFAFVPFMWPEELPNETKLPDRWRRLMTLAARVAGRLVEAPASAPFVLMPMLVVEGARGRWPIEPSWLSSIIGGASQERSRLAEDLVLDALKQIGPSAAVALLPALMRYLLADPTDGIRPVLFQRSPVRTWVLQNVSLAQAKTCLTDLQLEALWQYPHTLPPDILHGMLEDPDALPADALRTRIEAVRALGAEHADTLRALLPTTSLGEFAAERLWAVAPEIAQRVLEVPGEDEDVFAMRSLIVGAPAQWTGVVTRAILSHPEVLPESERREWARQRLPVAGPYVEAIGQVLALK